ncbi:Gfo/Idh/MocA family protein [Marinobacter sp.]|uniref:Gfo/Idh/MocA family protein n=1 Tax=Marinobacter sp. TaxID=50741 RepID=UPI00384C9078
MKQLKAAVVGVGHLGKFHARKYAALDKTSLEFVVDADNERARAIAKENGARVCNSHLELTGKVDIASVVVPTSHHYQVVRDLLEAKIHVLVEKPITTTPGEARDLIRIARNKGCLLQVGHLERFNPVMQALASRIETPMFIESHRIAPFKPRALDVDVVLDLMIHDIDLILDLVKSPVERLDASGSRVLSQATDIANARIQFANGCVANVTASRISLKQERRMRLFQSNAYFSADLAGHRLEIRRKSDREMFPGIPDIDSEIPELEPVDALESEIRAFATSVLAGLPPAVSGEDGLRALEMATAVIAQVGRTTPPAGPDEHQPHLIWRKHG